MDGTSSQYIILISSLFCCFFPQCSTASAFIPVRAEFTDPCQPRSVRSVVPIRINDPSSFLYSFIFPLLFLSLYIECPLTTIELPKGDRSRQNNILFITLITDLITRRTRSFPETITYFKFIFISMHNSHNYFMHFYCIFMIN